MRPASTVLVCGEYARFICLFYWLHSHDRRVSQNLDPIVPSLNLLDLKKKIRTIISLRGWLKNLFSTFNLSDILVFDGTCS